MTRLPTPGGDNNAWGNVLNNFLKVSHTSSGSLTSGAVSKAGAEMTSDKGVASGYAGLGSTGLVPAGQLGSGTPDNTTYLRGDGTWATPTGGGGGSPTLAGDSDVSISAPANSQVLTFNGTSGTWQNAAPLVTSVAGRTGAVTLSESDIFNLPNDLAAKLTATNNLSDLSNVANARTNLGLGTAATENVDVSAADIQPLGSQSAGSTGKVADAGHVHPMPTMNQLSVPTAAVSLNNQKITNLASGTASTDAVRFDQLPVADSTASDITVIGTATAAGSVGKWADAGHVHAGPNPIPGDVGMVAWTIDPAVPNTSGGVGALTGGVVYLTAVWVRAAATFSTLWMKNQAAGSGLTTGQCFAGLYNMSGTLLAATADQSTSWNKTGLMQMSFTSSVNVTAGKYFIAVLSNGTTGPSFLGTSTGIKLVNAGLTGASARVAINGTGNTSLPGTLTMSNNDPTSGTNVGLIGATLS